MSQQQTGLSFLKKMIQMYIVVVIISFKKQTFKWVQTSPVFVQWLRLVHSPQDKNIFFLEYYAPYAHYLINFLCIICYNDHFTWRKCILFGSDKVRQNILWCLWFLCIKSLFNFKKVFWKIFIHGYLMYSISNDYERTMNMPIKILRIYIPF